MERKPTLGWWLLLGEVSMWEAPEIYSLEPFRPQLLEESEESSSAFYLLERKWQIMSTSNRIYIEVTVDYHGRKAKNVEELLDQILDVFASSQGIEDPDLAADLGRHTLTFCMSVTDISDPTDALKRGAAAVRSALHACGESTQGWPVFDDNFGLTLHTKSEARNLLSA